MGSREARLSDIDQLMDEYRATRKAHQDVRDRLDVAIFNAKMSHATFRELAARTEKSVGWVQKALSRQGYVPVQRNN